MAAGANLGSAEEDEEDAAAPGEERTAIKQVAEKEAALQLAAEQAAEDKDNFNELVVASGKAVAAALELAVEEQEKETQARVAAALELAADEKEAAEEEAVEEKATLTHTILTITQTPNPYSPIALTPNP